MFIAGKGRQMDYQKADYFLGFHWIQYKIDISTLPKHYISFQQYLRRLDCQKKITINDYLN